MHRSSTSGLAVILVTALALAACSSGGSVTPTTTGPTTTAAVSTTTGVTGTTQPAGTTTTVADGRPPAPQAAPAAVLDGIKAALATGPSGCDPTDPTRCILPFPSNAYTKVDKGAPTGVRVDFPSGALPKNNKGVVIDPSEWNRNDGFSPNTPLLAHFADLDAAASKLPGWNDIGASLDPSSPVVLVDTTTGQRIALWAEMDAHAATDADRLLTIRPAISLPEGHTFAVGLRGLVDTKGAAIKPSEAFVAYRDNLTTGLPAIEDRRPSMELAFTSLAKAGAPRGDLQLAWTFTVASANDIAGRMLHIRDDALKALGDVAPKYTVTKVTPNSDTNIALHIEGTFTVPNYLTGDGSPGNRFHYDADPAKNPDALPSVNPAHPTLQASFMCNISNATMKGTTPAHAIEYGHGLLGSNDEINAGNVRDMSNEWNSVYCATKWSGLADEDVGNAAATLASMGSFPTVADRLQQGVLNQIFLGRLMTRKGGLADDPHFKRPNGSAILDTSQLYYDGNSQGGIMGLMLAAVSPDIQRAVLGVPGMNYSLLLPRSVDFDTYEAVMKPAYPSVMDRTLIFGFTQMLWDRGEGAGYVQHVTANPYEGTQAKTVLLDVAFGDHQVTPLSAMVEARTIGAQIHEPVVADGRGDLGKAAWGLDPLTYPSKGSAIIVWDSGMAPMPVENLAPRTGDDSHEDPRADATVRKQKASFLFDSALIDVCGAKACTAAHRK